MKLRNKKTGEIIALKDEGELALLKLIEDSLPNGLSLWEEVKEPLIKDEKIRKAVRAWAEANDITKVSHDAGWNAFRCTDFVIDFDHDFDRHDGLEDMRSYTIAELCGEEEE